MLKLLLISCVHHIGMTYSTHICFIAAPSLKSVACKYSMGSFPSHDRSCMVFSRWEWPWALGNYALNGLAHDVVVYALYDPWIQYCVSFNTCFIQPDLSTGSPPRHGMGDGHTTSTDTVVAVYDEDAITD